MHILSRNKFTKKSFDKTKCMYFMIKEEKVLNEYLEIWEKFRIIIQKKFNSDLIYNKNI